MSADSNQSANHIEGKFPGWRVVAGPFTVNAVQNGLRREEQRSALRAKEDQLKAGVAAKIVIYRNKAYVLREEKGWREQGKSGETRELHEGMLRCPCCGEGPFAEMGLRLHGCPKKGMVCIEGRWRKGRLDNDEIRIAKEALRAA